MSKLIYILSIILSLSFFSACGDSNEKEYVVLTSLKVNQPDKDLYIGDTYQLTTTHEPSNVKLPELTWKSSDTKVATVSSSGEVVAIADGVATITVSYGDLSNSTTIAVLKKQDYTSFTATNLSLAVNLPNVVVGYLIDGKFKKISDVGSINANSQSKEYILDGNSIKGIYFFADYAGTIKINKEYIIKPNTKNNFILSGDIETISVSDKSDPAQYPQ